MPVVTLYGKPGCTLCQEAEDVILDLRERRPFELVIRNILEDLVAYEEYKHDIPVIHVDGVEVARHRLTVEQLDRALGSP